MKTDRRTSSLGGLARGAGLAAGTLAAAAGWWITYSRFWIHHKLPLPKAIDADLRSFDSEAAGMLGYYQASESAGRPLLLVHSVNAAASSYEMGPVFSRFRARRPVVAVDLPGFGFSERSDRLYSARLYHEAILDLIGKLFDEPVDVVALSLGCEFAARAALIDPEKIRSLAFISPSGLGARRRTRGPRRAGLTGRGDRAHRVLSNRLWGLPLFDLIATQASIQFFLQQSFTGAVPDDMVRYAYASAHQPGAQFAPLYFLSGKLFTPNILPAFYARLEQPVLVLYDRDAYTGFGNLPGLIDARKNWQATRILPTRGLPQFERMDDVARELERFWEGE